MEELRFPGALSLTEELDQMVLLMLRDGKHIVGRLACLDQFTNIVLEEAAEWIIYKGMLAVQPVGLYIVRSDNIVIVSSFDEMKLSRMNLKKVTIDALLAAREGDEQQTEGKRERGQWNLD